MNKILEKIYLEKDIPTNVSIFFGSVVAFLFYYFKKDFYQSSFLFLAVFSGSKVVLNILSEKILTLKCIKKEIESYSKAEKETIATFVSRGTATIIFDDIKIDELIDGIRSLEARDKIEFIYNPTADPDAGPIGARLK